MCFCRISWQTVQPITLCYFCSRRKTFIHIDTVNGFEPRTSGKLHHTQTPTVTAWLSGPSSLKFLSKILVEYVIDFIFCFRVCSCKGFPCQSDCILDSDCGPDVDCRYDPKEFKRCCCNKITKIWIQISFFFDASIKGLNSFSIMNSF